MIRTSVSHLVTHACALLGLAIAVPGLPAQGQIVPDATLPVPSRVTPSSATLTIDGGTPVGANLFHSFQRFSIPANQRVLFNNADGIQRILTRVTGSQRSTIDGVLAASGKADLFLINPNGILFGPNARLDVGGTFVASTAEALQFAGGATFSAIEPAAPLLLITAPIGLQMGLEPAAVIARDAQLATEPGESFALVGGEIQVQGGTLSVSGGPLSLGAATGIVGLGSPDAASLDYQAAGQRGDIAIRGAAVTANGSGNSGIDLQGRRIQLRDGGRVEVINQGGGDDNPLTVMATEQITLGGVAGAPPSRLRTLALGNGTGADIIVNTRRLRLRPGGGIFAVTSGSGAGGSLSVAASEEVRVAGRGLMTLQGLLAQALSGNDILTRIDSGLSAVTLGPGEAGALTIDAPRLQLRQGALVTTASEGVGNAGDLILRAGDRIFLDDSYLVVAALTFGDAAAAGDGGDLRLAAPQITIRNGSSLIAATLGNGDSGDIEITATDRIEMFAVSDQVEFPQINTSSFFGKGAGGEIAITAGRLRLNRGGIRSQSGGLLSENLFNPTQPSAEFIRVPGGPAGEITLRLTDRLEVIGNGEPFGSSIDASSFTAFSPGQITVAAPTILLSNDGEISVDTRGSSPTGGQIDIQADRLLLNQQGRITTASLGENFIQGGQITIRAEQLVALENSDISADALTAGPGGRIEIEAPTIIGTAFRPLQTPESDITAASVSGDRGTVIIETRDGDVITDPPTLTTDFVDQSDRIVTSCATPAESRFVATGRGGLPAGPGQPLEDGGWQDLRLPDLPIEWDAFSSAANPPATLTPVAEPSSTAHLTEADGWRVNADGQVELVASGPAAIQAGTCQAS